MKLTQPSGRPIALRASMRVTAGFWLSASLCLANFHARIIFLLLALLPWICLSQVWAQSDIRPLPSSPPALFQIAGLAFGLDPSLLEAIATVESAGHTDAVSPKGAEGLMQLMPETARRFGVKHPFDPVENVFGAARFLAYLHENAGIEDLPQLLAAYNAGEGAVGRYGGLPPFPETREYVRRVLLTYLLGDEHNNLQGSSTNSYWLARPRVSHRIEQRLILRTSAPFWYPVAKPKTEADVFVQLEQIRSGRSRALKLQQSFRQAP
jgi:hypothetical protein